MIPQITEINFPSYATLNSATITLSEMGDRNITTQIKIDGDIVPDFSGWELEFKGERFILPVKEPQAAKDNTSRRSIVDLTFSSWAVQEMKRYFFVEMTSIESGTAIADKYKASLGLNIENFVIAFNNVLNYYFNGNIEMDLFGSGTGIYSAEPAFFEIDYTHIWDVLQKIYEIYEVRWTITYDSTTEKYVIKVGYPAAEIDDHEFEYGYEGGLLRFERQVQDYDITNVLLGRGGEKNLPYRYFKKVDPGNPNWVADPDAIPELKNIYFENLRDINFRRYVQGWKTNPNRILEEGDVVEAYDSARGETDFAYAKGHTDERFNPVEYVKDDASIAVYGERWGALENADDIYPTIQGIEVDPYGRIDQVVDVEPVTTDNIEAMAADAAEVTNVAGASRTEWINYNSTLELDINGADFSVPEGKVGNLTIQNTWFDTILYAKRGNDQVNVDPADAVHELVGINTTLSYVTVVNRSTGTELPPAGIPAGNYFYKLHIVVKAEFESSMYNSVNVTVGVNGMKLTTSEGSANAWKPTFDIWIKNIWDTTQQSGESDEQYAARVWEPILGDRTGEEAKVAFSTGFLSISEDYNFAIASIPVVDRTKTINGVASEWRITLIKSDAEYEATGKYIPNAETGGNASAGDYFFFTGIDMPWAYVLWAEEKLNAYKTAELAKLKQINPTWIIRIDKVRANTKEQGELEYLADRFASGAKLRVKDKRFTNGQVLTLYVQTVTYTWQEPSNGNPYLVPDIEVVLSDKVETVASPIDQLEGSVDLIQSTYAKISDIESAIRRVASPIFLKKTGESERSLSPTRFSSLMASESFRQGDIGGQGWGAYTDGEGHSVLEADTIVVRKDMRVNTLTINQIAYLGGKQIISAAAMECTKVDDTDSGYVCYFDQKQGSVANLFKVDDIVLGQVWNADESEQRYYKRKVIAVSTDSITLSKDIADGDGVPQPKDIMVQYGSYSDTSRQYVIVRDVIGGGYERMLSGLTTVYANGNEYYFAGRQSGSTPRWFVGDANGQHASYQNGVLNITGRLSVTTQVDKGNGTYESLSNYLSSLQDQIDGNIQTWYATGEPTLQNYPASTWPTVEDKNNHIGDLYYESETGKAYRFMLDGNTYKWVQIADEDIAAALALAQQNQTAIAGLAYLKAATNQGTLVQGGLVLTSMIQLGQTEEGVYKVYSGINGIMDTSALGNGIAAWYGGPMADIGADSTLTDFAKSLFRFDGSGYLASGNIKWDLNGNGEIPGISWNNGRITLSPDIYLQGGDRLTQIVDAVNRMYTQFAYDSHDNITVAPTHALYIPTTSPEYPIAGKVALYYDYNGNYAELPSGGGGGDVYDLIYKKNGITITTINLGTEEGVINVTVGWNDLTPDSTHRFLTDTQISTWDAKQNAISDLATIRSNASTAATAVDVQQGSCLAVVNGHLTVDTQELDSEMGFGAAAYKGVATSVASGNTNLVTSGAVYTAIQNASPDLSGYLPLSAGSGKKLTGPLYFDVSSANKSIYANLSGGAFEAIRFTTDGHTYFGIGNNAGSRNMYLYGKLVQFTFGASTGTKSLVLDTGVIRPGSNSDVSLGTSSYKWKELYATTLYGNLALSYLTGADDLKAIEALTDTSGFLKKTAANTWALTNDIEATSLKTTTEEDAMFTYRHTPSVAVGDMAKVLCVKGKSIVWNQILQINTNAGPWTSNGVTMVNNRDGSYTFNGTATASGFINSNNRPVTFVSQGHKYYIFVSKNNIDIYFTPSAFNLTIIDGSTYTRYIASSNRDGNPYMRLSVISGVTYNNVTVWPYIIDLTQMYGAGNEPATVEEFEALYPLPYYDYNTGKLVNNTASGVEMLDADGNSLGTIPLNITGLTSGGVQIFPDGMKSAGTAYDEWSGNTATRRIGSRAYQSGDENDSSVVTDKTTTYYPLATPETYTVDALPDILVQFDAAGTQRRLPVDTSEEVAAPMVCDFQYGANIGDLLPTVDYKIRHGHVALADEAIKLQTARTIWGQSFDGTANVSGALTEVTDITGTGLITMPNGKFSSSFIIPHIAPSGTLETGEVYFWSDTTGIYSEMPSGSGGDVGDIYPLTVVVNGVQTVYNPAEQRQTLTLSIPTALSSLTDDAAHRLVTDTQISTWNAKQAAISDLATIRSNANLGAAAYGWGDHRQAGYLTSYTETDPVFSASAAAGITSTDISDWNGKQDAISDLATIRSNASTAATAVDVQQDSYLFLVNGHLALDYQAFETYLDLGDAAYKDYIASVVSGSANLVTSDAVYTAVSAKYTKPSTGIPKADLASAVQTSLGKADTALQSVAFSDLTSHPTTIAGYGITDAKIANGTITLGSNSITPLTSFTETDPTVPAWAKAANKPTYTLDEIANGTTRSLANYLPLTGGTMIGNLTTMNILAGATSATVGTLAAPFNSFYSGNYNGIGQFGAVMVADNTSYSVINATTSFLLIGRGYSASGLAKSTTLCGNYISFEVGSLGGVVTINSNGNITPNADGAYDFGGAIRRWSTVYANILNAATGITTAGTLSVTGESTFTGNLLPKTTNATDIGSSSKKFKDLYLAGTATVNGISSSGNILPSSTGLALGSSSNKWAALWTDDLSVNGAVLTSLIPDDGVFNLGASGAEWNSVFANTVYTGDFVVSGTVLGDLIPDDNYDLGSSSTGWGNLYVTNIYDSGEIRLSANNGKVVVEGLGGLFHYNDDEGDDFGLVCLGRQNGVEKIFVGNDDEYLDIVLNGHTYAFEADVANSLAIPKVAPSNPDANKAYLWVNPTGNYAESPQS